MELDQIFAGLYIGIGIYAVLSAIKMKVQNVLPKQFLLGNRDEKSCKNREEYIRKAFPSIVITGVAITACGIMDMVNVHILKSNTVSIVVTTILFLIVTVYLCVTVKLNKLYF